MGSDWILGIREEARSYLYEQRHRPYWSETGGRGAGLTAAEWENGERKPATAGTRWPVGASGKVSHAWAVGD